MAARRVSMLASIRESAPLIRQSPGLSWTSSTIRQPRSSASVKPSRNKAADFGCTMMSMLAVAAGSAPMAFRTIFNRCSGCRRSSVCSTPRATSIASSASCRSTAASTSASGRARASHSARSCWSCRSSSTRAALRPSASPCSWPSRLACSPIASSSATVGRVALRASGCSTTGIVHGWTSCSCSRATTQSASLIPFPHCRRG
jgi:hypothetical protein